MPRRQVPCGSCSNLIRNENKTGLCKTCYDEHILRTHQKHVVDSPPVALAADREKSRMAAELSGLRLKYNEALKTISRLEEEQHVHERLANTVDTFRIAPKTPTGHGEATAVLVASDWHMEESVGPEVGDLNRYDTDIAKVRATKFFTAGLRLIRLLQQDVTISNLVLALLGDFITNDIHEELVETNLLTPTDALVLAQNTIISGIEFLLANSDLTLTIVCHSGNHARTTKTTRFTTENGHSLEYLMYLHLAAYFREQPRVTFIIPDGMHSYVQIYEHTVRFHHGHAVKYQGGVGGIYIPVAKSINQWNKGKWADLDVFGHFHQLKDGGNFICNGSLIGYNAFALSIKADYEEPKQVLFLIDKRRGRTCTWPIIFR